MAVKKLEIFFVQFWIISKIIIFAAPEDLEKKLINFNSHMEL